MLSSSQRIGLRFCIDSDGRLIDSRTSEELNAMCRTCGTPVMRHSPNQFFQHADKQCEGSLFSELLERLSSTFIEIGHISLPITFDNSESTAQDVIAAEVNYEHSVIPILALTLTGGQLIYLSLRTEDYVLSHHQLKALRESFQSVIEMDISTLTLPSSGLTAYLRTQVVSESFINRCTWLALSPLAPLTRTIATLEANTLSKQKKQAEKELSSVQKHLQEAQTELRFSAEILDKVALYKSAEALKNERTHLIQQVNNLTEKKSQLESQIKNGAYSHEANQLASQVETLREQFRSGRRHVREIESEIDFARKNLSSVENQAIKKRQELESLDKKLSEVNWMTGFLSHINMTFEDFQSVAAKVDHAFNQLETLEKRIKSKNSNLVDLDEQLSSKSKVLSEAKSTVDFYSKQKFALFREVNQLREQLAEVKGGD
ncbi:hypothetical protein [Photobacterium lipolyticum]|uniref:Uncharacterized protein n=1 Tax=Photobacterium lipolyticum TaxID=266810 RepID=A0A2T3N377_9GAMM|nr:hypothetical protein [Photobacterium lipolyticum]PSW06734.1 hypothetical protein C9I89_04155 [Photobacterium lipolyticum]